MQNKRSKTKTPHRQNMFQDSQDYTARHSLKKASRREEAGSVQLLREFGAAPPVRVPLPLASPRSYPPDLSRPQLAPPLPGSVLP